MADIVTGVRQLIQDLIAPDLKAHTAKLDGLQRQTDMLQRSIDTQYDSLVKTLDAFRAEMRSEFASLRASNQLEVLRQVSPLSERVALVESRLDQQ